MKTISIILLAFIVFACGKRQDAPKSVTREYTTSPSNQQGGGTGYQNKPTYNTQKKYNYTKKSRKSYFSSSKSRSGRRK